MTNAVTMAGRRSVSKAHDRRRRTVRAAPKVGSPASTTTKSPARAAAGTSNVRLAATHNPKPIPAFNTRDRSGELPCEGAPAPV